MISARGATPCNLMLNEVGRAHVANAVPIVYQPAEVFQVWSAVCEYLRGALLGGINVQLFRKTLSFSCTKRKPFKKIPAGFHREAQTYDLRVPLFGCAPAFAVTYSLDTPIIEDPGLTYQPMPLKTIADAAKVPSKVVAAVLHDVMRFVGEALFQGRLLELEFPGVCMVRAKRDRVMTVFDDAFTAQLLAIDTRKWPAVYATEARELLLKKQPVAGGAPGTGRPSSARPNSARSSKAGAAAAAAAVAAVAAAAPKHPAPFVTAPTPAGRTFDEMYDIRKNESQRKKRASSSSGPRPLPSASLMEDAPPGGAADGGDAGMMAVVYDESVPASQLGHSPVQHRNGNENVYDMVMPHPAGGRPLDMSTSGPPQAASQMPPAPQPRPASPPQQQQDQNRPPTGSAASVQRPGFVPRRLITNSHANIFGWGGVAENDTEAPVSRKRILKNPVMTLPQPGEEQQQQQQQQHQDAPAEAAVPQAAA